MGLIFLGTIRCRYYDKHFDYLLVILAQQIYHHSDLVPDT